MVEPEEFILEHGLVPINHVKETLVHEYDPVKAREYYLRTRQLKGRKTGSKETPSAKRPIAMKRSKEASSPTLQLKKETLSRVSGMKEKLDSLGDLVKQATVGSKKVTAAERKAINEKLEKAKADLKAAVAKAKNNSETKNPAAQSRRNS